MKNRFGCALGIVAASFVLSGILTVPVRASEALLPVADPPGATCYHFPLITVCCDGGGCYILR